MPAITSLIDQFEIAIIQMNSTEEGKLKFKNLCNLHLERGYKFNFVMTKAIIDDLADCQDCTIVNIQNAKQAIHNLLPYALNLCRFPTRQEYRLVKVCIAYI